MTSRTPTIVATSIGFRPAGHGMMDFQLGPSYAHAAALARAGGCPRVSIVGTALGDASDWLASMYCAFGRVGWRAGQLDPQPPGSRSTQPPQPLRPSNPTSPKHPATPFRDHDLGVVGTTPKS